MIIYIIKVSSDFKFEIIKLNQKESYIFLILNLSIKNTLFQKFDKIHFIKLISTVRKTFNLLFIDITKNVNDNWQVETTKLCEIDIVCLNASCTKKNWF